MSTDSVVVNGDHSPRDKSFSYPIDKLKWPDKSDLLSLSFKQRCHALQQLMADAMTNENTSDR
jgi:hypothetical protein